MENWDTSLVTDMSSAFNRKSNFNGDISGWDTSAVTDMAGMFYAASAFNQDISKWHLQSDEYEFHVLKVPQPSIKTQRWVTSAVTNMCSMFRSRGL